MRHAYLPSSTRVRYVYAIAKLEEDMPRVYLVAEEPLTWTERRAKAQRFATAHGAREAAIRLRGGVHYARRVSAVRVIPIEALPPKETA